MNKLFFSKRMNRNESIKYENHINMIYGNHDDGRTRTNSHTTSNTRTYEDRKGGEIPHCGGWNNHTLETNEDNTRRVRRDATTLPRAREKTSSYQERRIGSHQESESKKVVIDTNVFVSGIHWKGFSEKILVSWNCEKFILITSEPLLEELFRILRSFKIPLPEEKLTWWENTIRREGCVVTPTCQVDIIKDDPSDNKFLEAAIEGNASYIVSQDKQLLKIKEYSGIKIVKPEEFLNCTEKSRCCP